MEQRFVVRQQQMLAECAVTPELFAEWEKRLAEFTRPFAALLTHEKQREHAGTYVSGLLSRVERKNVESIAYEHDQDRQNLQHFVGQAEWDDAPLRRELARQVGQELGEADGVLVFDPSAYAKKGRESAGVARQWCGRLGKLENCQVAVYLAYVARGEHTLVDTRLYLPREWTNDRPRLKKVGVPKSVRFATRHALALQMLDERGAVLPHRWVTGDDEMGRSTAFRRALRERNEWYLLAIPSNTTVRDLETPPPEYGGRGRRPQRPFVRVDRWTAELPAEAWTIIDVRDGTKGPLVVEAVKRRVLARTERAHTGAEETLVVFRTAQDDGSWKHDYTLADAPQDTSMAEFARVLKAEHRIEECFERGKSEVGLGQYEVRGWRGWHHHQTLTLIASWFLVRETLRGKKIHAGLDGAASPQEFRAAAVRPHRPPQTGGRGAIRRAPTASQRPGGVLSLEETQPLASLAG